MAEITAEQAYAGGVKNKLGQESLGRSSDKNKYLSVRCTRGDDHDRVYDQYTGDFRKGINGCTWCKTGGEKYSTAVMNPSILSRMVNPERDGKVSYRNKKKIELTCCGNVYWQSAAAANKGQNACPTCGHRGDKNSFKRVRTDLLERLVNPETDGNVSSKSDKPVLVKCYCTVPLTGEVTVYEQRAFGLSEGKNGCPACNSKTGWINHVEITHPDVANRLVNPEDRKLSKGYNARSSKFWCDGVVQGNPKHPKTTFDQVMLSATAGNNACPICGKGSGPGKAKRAAHFIEALSKTVAWNLLSDVERAAIVRGSYGINPNSSVGGDLIRGDLESARQKIEEISSDEESEEIFGGSDDEELPLDRAEDSEDFEEDGELPDVSIKDGLIAADEALALGTEIVDQTVIDFLVYSQVAKAWRTALRLSRVDGEVGVEKYVRELRYNWKTNVIREAKKEFLRQYQAAVKIKPPANWDFWEPNLMQKYVAFMVKEKKKFGNWSGTGSGKTGSAVLAARIVKAKKILVVCPNNTIGGWEETILKGDPNAQVRTKTAEPEWSGRSAKWLVVNPEVLVGHGKKLLDSNKFDMVVIDEVHWMKERKGSAVSQRRKILMDIRKTLGDNDHLLAMSATPVINDISEGASLVELVDGVKPEIGNRVTENNVLLLHMNLVRVGTRAIIPPPGKLNDNPLVDIDISELDGKVTKKMSHISIEKRIARTYIPKAVEVARACKDRGKGLMIYTEFVDGIVEPYTKALEAAGLKVSHFMGSEEKATIRTLKEDGVDVLIGTRAIGTGVDGVQKWTDTIFYATLPWTDAEFEQSRARVYRQGQEAEEITVIVPNGIIDVGADEPWSWTKFRWGRIQHKKNIAQAAVSGVLPETMIYSVEETKKAAFEWKERLEKEASGE